MNHRYSAHAGAAPNEVRAGIATPRPPAGYRPPTRLPAKGRIEAIRFVRSNGLLDLGGHKTILDQPHSHQYVTAIIAVRAKQLRVITRHGEIIHTGPFDIDRTLR